MQVLGPDSLADVVAGYKLAAALQAVVELGVPALLADGAMTAAELGERLGVDAAGLERVLQALVSRGALIVEQDRYANSPLTESLSSGHSREMFLGWQAMPAFFQAWSGLAGALRTGRSPFEVVHGSDLHAYFTSHPGDAASYETAMGSTVEDFEEFAESVDLSERSTVVCVGGASGIELVPILARWPNLRGVLTDLPDALINAADVLAAHGITDRVTVVPGDARTAAPPGDVYVLSTVLRCLSEPDAVAMLSACRAAALPAAVLHVIEMPLPDGHPQHPNATTDLTAWVIYGGADRTIGEWDRIHHAAGWHDMTITRLSGPYAVLTFT